MPSFFKKIQQKFFSKAAEQNSQSIREEQGEPQSQKPAREKNPEHSTRENPFMDENRAKKIHARVIPLSEHQINFRNIDNNAVKIVKDLQRAGYESYLVGGCVRDLLLNKRPKDFDVTTGAHPEQAHKVFNRSRLIGRRFKLLHVRFGRDLIEVATFRADHQEHSTENQAKQAESGMILRDNVYGTIDQDAMRRDFTINALYYDVNTRSIYDFTNGFEDMSLRQIRMIGDPSERYKEDPVRMLRAIRFAAKLDFNIEPKTAEPIQKLAPMLFDIAPARLFDEVLKLLQSGHGIESIKLLQEYCLLETILPQTSQALKDNLENAEQLIFNALKNTDRRIKQRKSVSPGFLYATLLWPTVQSQLNTILSQKKVPPLSALYEVSSKVIGEQVKRTSIPKRFSSNIREIWELQLRLTYKPAAKAEQLLEHPRFRAAYDLLVLREKSGEDLNGISQWWTDYQDADAEQKELLITSLKMTSVKATKKKKVAKSHQPKAAFEKFDVVEQVKPQSAKRSKTSRAKSEVLDTDKKATREIQFEAAQPKAPAVAAPVAPKAITAQHNKVTETITESKPAAYSPRDTAATVATPVVSKAMTPQHNIVTEKVAESKPAAQSPRETAATVATPAVPKSMTPQHNIVTEKVAESKPAAQSPRKTAATVATPAVPKAMTLQDNIVTAKEIESKPAVQSPRKNAATTSSQETSPAPRKKVRRSRAKNDPRNK